MNDFIALITATAWPVAMLTVAILFRHEVRGVLTRLGQFKYGGVEMTFRDDLRDAESLARAVPHADPSADPATVARVQLEVAQGTAVEVAGTMVGHETATASTILIASPVRSAESPSGRADAWMQRCVDSPRSGVLDVWAELRLALIQAAAKLGDRRMPAPVRDEGAIRFLVDRGWIAPLEGQLLERLRTLAAQVEARDAPPVTLDDARRFVDLAAPVAARLRALDPAG